MPGARVASVPKSGCGSFQKGPSTGFAPLSLEEFSEIKKTINLPLASVFFVAVTLNVLVSSTPSDVKEGLNHDRTLARRNQFFKIATLFSDAKRPHACAGRQFSSLGVALARL